MKMEKGPRMTAKNLSQASCRLTAGGFFLWAACALLSAQNVVLTGSLSGRVLDQSGAVVPGASVVVQNLATGVQQTATSNRAGLYQFPALTPGTYSITASLQGFRDVEV